MKLRGFGLAVLVLAVSVLAATARWSALAQDRGARRAAPQAEGPAPGSVMEAMLRPFDLPFGEATTLEEVRAHLAKALKAPVVLDLAALDRLELAPDDTVLLELKGVRLKIGLKLLLDQVGLSYRVVPEDNLLVLTDAASGGDPAERALAALKELHRDLHDVQDAVDDLRDLVEEELGIEPEADRGRKPVVRAGSPRPGRDGPPAPRRSRADRKPAGGVRG